MRDTRGASRQRSKRCAGGGPSPTGDPEAGKVRGGRARRPRRRPAPHLRYEGRPRRCAHYLWPFAHYGVAVLVSAIIDLTSNLPTPIPTATPSGATTAAATAGSAPGFYDAGLGRFLISPGLGGVAALLGGVLAYLAANKKSRDDRAKARDEREQAQRDRWWETLTWVYDGYRAPEPHKLPGKLAMGVLKHLFDEAKTEHRNVEVAAVVGLFEMTEKQVSDEDAKQAEPQTKGRTRWSRPKGPA